MGQRIASEPTLARATVQYPFSSPPWRGRWPGRIAGKKKLPWARITLASRRNTCRCGGGSPNRGVCSVSQELLSRGSVFGLAGLFKFAVKGLRTDQEEDEQKRSPLRGSKADSKGLVVRVHGSTKLRLSPTTRYGRSGVGIDEPSVVLAPLDASAPGCGNDPHRMRMNINGNANEQASKLAGEMYCKGGVGFDVHRSTRKPVSPTVFQGPVVTPSLPAYLAPSTANWIRNVEQDVGGLRNQVATVVAAVAMTLRRHEGTALTAPASGLLLHGPTGAGKTLLARCVDTLR